MLTITGDGHTEVVTDDVTGVSYETHTHVHHFLQQEGQEYIIRHIPVNEDNVDRILARVEETNATIASIDSHTVKAVWIQGRDWLDLEQAVVENGPKVLKRLGMFFTSSSLSATYAEGDLDIKVVPVLEEDKPYHDGRVFIHRRVLDDMLHAAQVAMELDGLDEATIERKLEALDQRVGNIRGLLPDCMLKGDAIVVDDLEADIVIPDPDDNLKYEVAGVKGVVRLILTPHHQWGTVRADRQTLSLLGGWLFPEGFLEDALTEKVDQAIEKLNSGTPMFTQKVDDVEQDQLASMQERAMRFAEVAGSLNESVYFTQMNATQFIKAETTVRQPDDVVKRFPVPFSVRNYMRNSVDYNTVYGLEAPNGINEVAFTPFGVVLPDTMHIDGRIVEDAISVQLAVHGGGDWDDALVNHIRVAEDSDEFFGIAAGDVISINQRQPTGVVSDGEQLYLEYTVTKVTASSIPAVLRHFGVDSTADLPRIRMADRPNSVLEMPELEPAWVPEGGSSDGDFTIDMLLERVHSLIESSGGYGIHANQMMAAARLGVVFPFFTDEENWIDTFQQEPTPQDLAVLIEQNEIMEARLIESNVAFDPHEARRLGFTDPETGEFIVPIEEGVFSHLVDYHRQEMARFGTAANTHIVALKAQHESRASKMVGSQEVRRGRVHTPQGTVVTDLGVMPYVLARLFTEERAFMARHRLNRREYYQGGYNNHVAGVVLGNMGQAVREGRMTPEDARAFIMEAYLYAHEAMTLVNNPSHGRVYANGERLLMSGAMFAKVLDVITEAKDSESFIPVREEDLPF